MDIEIPKGFDTSIVDSWWNETEGMKQRNKKYGIDEEIKEKKKTIFKNIEIYNKDLNNREKDSIINTMNIKSVEDLIKKELNILDVSYSGIDNVEQINEINKGILEFKKIFSDIKIDGIKTISITGNSLGVVPIQHESIGIIGSKEKVECFLRINKDFFNRFSNVEEVNKYIESNYICGQIAAENIKELIWHELWHNLTDKNKSYDTIISQIKTLENDKFGNEFSFRGGLNGIEGIAEAGVMYLKGEIISDYARKIIKKYTGKDI